MTTTPTTMQARPSAEYIAAQGAHYAVAPFTIRRAYGTLRKAGAAYLEANHYVNLPPPNGGGLHLNPNESGWTRLAS